MVIPSRRRHHPPLPSDHVGASVDIAWSSGGSPGHPLHAPSILSRSLWVSFSPSPLSSLLSPLFSLSFSLPLDTFLSARMTSSGPTAEPRGSPISRSMDTTPSKSANGHMSSGPRASFGDHSQESRTPITRAIHPEPDPLGAHGCPFLFFSSFLSMPALIGALWVSFSLSELAVCVSIAAAGVRLCFMCCVCCRP